MKVVRYAMYMPAVCVVAWAMSSARVVRLLPPSVVSADAPLIRAHSELPDQPFRPAASAAGPGSRTGGAASQAIRWQRGPYVSIQVNVDHTGANIVGDAANEPSIAFDPTDPRRFVVGWRQFDSVQSNFRQAGWAYSHDAGRSWTSPGVVRPGAFSSDPVVRADRDGTFHYLSLQPDRGPGDWACHMYSSFDGGASWSRERYALGGDKAWFTVDRTNGVGRGHLYVAWSSPLQSCCGANDFTRSTDGGDTYATPTNPGVNPRWGTMDVGPDGALYVAGADVDQLFVGRSDSAQNAAATPEFELTRLVAVGGVSVDRAGPNPDGLLGMVWIATDHSGGITHGNVYVLASVDPPGADPLDVVLISSTDRGVTWSDPVRVNDDPPGTNAWQWFGTMSVAPNGRIDVVFNDTRNAAAGFTSELFYAASVDGGHTFSANVVVSPAFDPSEGYPQQQKLGDYYDMNSDDLGVNVAYAATFNGEQDVYYLRIGSTDCNGNGVADDEDIATATSADCQPNGLPDECEADCNENGIADACDIVSGYSADCSGNRIPDECDPDCNENGIEDLCDVLGGGSADCDDNSIPDECDPDCDGDGVIDACDEAVDTDEDGLDDCDDECPNISPTPVCVCPPFGECCFDANFCFELDRQECLDNGWIPTCVEAACCNGCLFGDADRDGDIDLRDAQMLQRCFTGPDDLAGYSAPTDECRDRFDADCDGDVDLDDYVLHAGHTVP